MFIALPNRFGSEGLIEFYGSSCLIDPFGRTLVEAPRDEAAALVAEIDLGQRDDWLTLFPFFATRRPDTYGALTDARVNPRLPRRKRRGRRDPGNSAIVIRSRQHSALTSSITYKQRLKIAAKALHNPSFAASFRVSTRALVRPIGLDMVEVASSNLAGPTKYDRPGRVPGFSYLALALAGGSN